MPADAVAHPPHPRVTALTAPPRRIAENGLDHPARR
jgi:hypothetical protein